MGNCPTTIEQPSSDVKTLAASVANELCLVMRVATPISDAFCDTQMLRRLAMGYTASLSHAFCDNQICVAKRRSATAKKTSFFILAT